MKLPLLVFTFFCISSCAENNGSVKVTCNDVEKIQSNLGIINISQRSLGDIILLDTLTKSSFYMRHLEIPKKNIESSTARDSMILLSSSVMNFHFEGDVSKADEVIKASITSNIENNTMFFLSNCIRKTIYSPVNEINYSDSTYESEYKNILQKDKRYVLAFVTSILCADKFEFRLKNQSNGEVGTNIIEVANFKVAINYTCQNNIRINARHDGVFYKVSFFTLDNNNKLVFTPMNIDLSEYNMSQSFI